MNENKQHSFSEEIDDAILDIEYGCEKVEILIDHPLSDINQIAIIKVLTKDNLDLTVKMCWGSGYSLIEYISNSNSDDIDKTQSFDSLPNLLMYYSPEFQNQFGLKLFERLSKINNK